MAFVIYEDIIRKIDRQIEDLMDIDIDKLYEDHLNEQNQIEFDSFVFDRHTGAITSRSDFALEGARVSNECQQLFIEKYREMYNEFKIIIDNDEEQTKQKKRKIKDSSTTKKKPKVTLKKTNFKLNEIFFS